MNYRKLLLTTWTNTSRTIASTSKPKIYISCWCPDSQESIRENSRGSSWPGARFSKAPETFRARKAIAKSRTLRLQSCFIHIVSIWTEVLFIQEVSGVYTSPFLDTDELKMALRARKLFGAFEKRAPGLSFRLPGLSPYRGREEMRVQGLDYQWGWTCEIKNVGPQCMFFFVSSWTEYKWSSYHYIETMAFKN